MLRHFAAHAHPWQSLIFQTRKSAPLSHDSGVNLPFCLFLRYERLFFTLAIFTPTLALIRIHQTLGGHKSMPFFLGKRTQGDQIMYEAAAPLKRYKSYTFIGATGPFLSRLGATYYATRGRGNPAIVTPADAERLAIEDNTGAWPFIREQIKAEMLMTLDELAATGLDMACEYEPDIHQSSAIWVGALSPSLCEAEI
jgi:hypothetical protein